MSIHDELMAGAAELHAEVQGRSAGFTYQPKNGDAIVLDLLMRGGVRNGAETVGLGRETDGDFQTERCIVKVPGMIKVPNTETLVPFVPELTASGKLADDERWWNIDGYSGAGTRFVTIELSRVEIEAKGRSNRFFKRSQG